jgi:hypothetical protein
MAIFAGAREDARDLRREARMRFDCSGLIDRRVREVRPDELQRDEERGHGQSRQLEKFSQRLPPPSNKHQPARR